MFKIVLLQLFILFNSANAAVLDSYNLEQVRSYQFGACDNITNLKYPLAAKLLEDALDILFLKNSSVFQINQIERKDLCVKITDDYNINAYVVPLQKNAGIVYFHKKQILKDARNFSTLVSVLSHEVAHIIMNHHDGNLSQKLTDEEKILQTSYNIERDKRFGFLTKLKEFVEELSVNNNYPANHIIKKLIENSYFTAWQYPVLSSEAISRASSLSNEQKIFLKEYIDEDVFDLYNVLSHDMHVADKAEAKLKRKLVTSYDKRFGSNQLISYQEREADEVGFMLFRNVGLGEFDYFTYPKKTFFSFFMGNDCDDYKEGSDLSYVSMADSDHPSTCYRKQNIQKLVSSNKQEFLDIELNSNFNSKYKKQLDLVLEEIK